MVNLFITDTISHTTGKISKGFEIDNKIHDGLEHVELFCSRNGDSKTIGSATDMKWHHAGGVEERMRDGDCQREQWKGKRRKEETINSLADYKNTILHVLIAAGRHRSRLFFFSILFHTTKRQNAKRWTSSSYHKPQSWVNTLQIQTKFQDPKDFDSI